MTAVPIDAYTILQDRFDFQKSRDGQEGVIAQSQSGHSALAVFPKPSEFQVVRPEAVSPFRNAVRLVNARKLKVGRVLAQAATATPAQNIPGRWALRDRPRVFFA